jgi:hypothetical protein
MCVDAVPRVFRPLSAEPDWGVVMDRKICTGDMAATAARRSAIAVHRCAVRLIDCGLDVETLNKQGLPEVGYLELECNKLRRSHAARTLAERSQWLLRNAGLLSARDPLRMD